MQFRIVSDVRAAPICSNDRAATRSGNIFIHFLNFIAAKNADVARIIYGDTEESTLASVRKLILSSASAYYAVASCEDLVGVLGYKFTPMRNQPAMDMVSLFAKVSPKVQALLNGGNRGFCHENLLPEGGNCLTGGVFRDMWANKDAKSTNLVAVKAVDQTYEALRFAAKGFMGMSNAPDKKQLLDFSSCLNAFMCDHGESADAVLCVLLDSEGGDGGCHNKVLGAYLCCWGVMHGAKRVDALAGAVTDSSIFMKMCKFLDGYSIDELDTFKNPKRLGRRRARRLDDDMAMKRQNALRSLDENRKYIEDVKALQREEVFCKRGEVTDYGEVIRGEMKINYYLHLEAPKMYEYVVKKTLHVGVERETLWCSNFYSYTFPIPEEMTEWVKSVYHSRLGMILGKKGGRVHEQLPRAYVTEVLEVMQMTRCYISSAIHAELLTTYNLAVKTKSKRDRKILVQETAKGILTPAKTTLQKSLDKIALIVNLGMQAAEEVGKGEGGANMAKMISEGRMPVTDAKRIYGFKCEDGAQHDCDDDGCVCVDGVGWQENEDDDSKSNGKTRALRCCLNNQQKRVVAKLFVRIFGDMTLNRVLSTFLNTKPGAQGFWKYVAGALHVGKLLKARKKGSMLTLALHMLFQTEYPKSRLLFEKMQWDRFIGQPLAQLFSAQDIALHSGIYERTGVVAMNISDYVTLRAMGGLLDQFECPVATEYNPEIAGTRIPRLRGTTDCNALIARRVHGASGPCASSLCSSESSWRSFLRFGRPSPSYILQNICTICMHVDREVVCNLLRSICAYATKSDACSIPVAKVLAALSALHMLTMKILCFEEGAGEATVGVRKELGTRPRLLSLGTRTVRDVSGSSFVKRYSPTVTRKIVVGDVAKVGLLDVECALEELLISSFLSRGSTPNTIRNCAATGHPCIVAPLPTLEMSNLKPSGSPAPMPEFGGSDCMEMLKGASYSMDVMVPGWSEHELSVVFMSAWDCTDYTDFCSCMDLSLAVLGVDGDGKYEIIFVVDWTCKGDLENMGVQHGGDGWGCIKFVQDRPDPNNIMSENIGVNFAKLRSYTRQTYSREAVCVVACIIDWNENGWDELKDASMCIVNPSGRGSGPWGCSVVSSLKVVDPHDKPLHICYAIDIRKQGEESISLVAQASPVRTNMIAEAGSGIHTVLKAVLDGRRESAAPSMSMFGSLYTLGMMGCIEGCSLFLPGNPVEGVAALHPNRDAAVALGGISKFLLDPAMWRDTEQGVRTVVEHVRTLAEGACVQPRPDVVIVSAARLNALQVSAMFAEAGFPTGRAPRKIYILDIFSTEKKRDAAVQSMQYPDAPEVVVVHGWDLGHTATEVTGFMFKD